MWWRSGLGQYCVTRHHDLNQKKRYVQSSISNGISLSRNVDVLVLRLALLRVIATGCRRRSERDFKPYGNLLIIGSVQANAAIGIVKIQRRAISESHGCPGPYCSGHAATADFLGNL